jgi:hypothetical protein
VLLEGRQILLQLSVHLALPGDLNTNKNRAGYKINARSDGPTQIIPRLWICSGCEFKSRNFNTLTTV